MENEVWLSCVLYRKPSWTAPERLVFLVQKRWVADVVAVVYFF